MAQCPNCKKNLGCSCKLRTSKTGKRGCTSCVNTINNNSNAVSKITKSGRILKVKATQKK
jgi:hypothetical protein